MPAHGFVNPLRAPQFHSTRLRPGAFTLIELLLSITILAVLMLIVTNVISVVQKTWVRSNSKVSEFREGRMAFDTIARNLAQATLNVYWQSVEPIGKATVTFQTLADKSGALADAYVRRSELQFVCGKTPGLIGFGSPAEYPGHGVFFQAPLGVTNLVSGGTVNTENMVNLLCGRGYFVSWGNDEAFRPAFLGGLTTVPPRFRYRLMEYSPTAEQNRIYDSTLRPIVDLVDTSKNHSKKWFQSDVLAGSGKVQAGEARTGETVATRAFVRPLADNVLCLVISPQVDTRSASVAGQSTSYLAPAYEYDSLMKSNPGAPAPAAKSQGTQHLLPPLVRLTMVILDSASGEKLAENSGSSALRAGLSDQLSRGFTDASNYDSPDSQYRRDIAALEAFLIERKLNYRIFTTTVIMKQARWSA